MRPIIGEIYKAELITQPFAWTLTLTTNLLILTRNQFYLQP